MKFYSDPSGKLGRKMQNPEVARVQGFVRLRTRPRPALVSPGTPMLTCAVAPECVLYVLARIICEESYEYFRLRPSIHDHPEAHSLRPRDHGNEGVHLPCRADRTVSHSAFGVGQRVPGLEGGHDDRGHLPGSRDRHGPSSTDEGLPARGEHRPHRGVDW